MKTPSSIFNALFILFITQGFIVSGSCVAKDYPWRKTGIGHGRTNKDIELSDIKMEPAFALVRKHNRIQVEATLSNPYPRHYSHQKLILERQWKLANGKIKFRPVAFLRDDGKKGDSTANDNIYSATLSIRPHINQDIIFRIVTSGKKYHKHITSYPITLPVKSNCGPVGSIFPTTILTTDSETDNFTYQFDIPESQATPRETILTIVNGARVNASINDRISRAIFMLNGARITKVRKSNNIQEIPISLKTGSNTLSITHLRGKADQRLAFHIDACADQIALSPVNDTLLAGRDQLSAQASVTAYGLPVAGAEVIFSVSDALVSETPKSATTSTSGSAQQTFNLIAAGDGLLTANITDSLPELSVSIPFKAISEPSISLNQGFKSLQLETGEQESTPFFLFYTLKNAGVQQVQFERFIEPNNGGVQLSGGEAPVNGYSVNGPTSFSFEPTITAVTPGDYVLTAKASNLTTGETINKTVLIHVVETGTPDPLTLGKPGMTPSGISPLSSEIVTVRALAQGTSTPPDSIWLDEVNADGQVVNAGIAELKDDGASADATAGDYIYTAQLQFTRDSAQDIWIRVRADYFGQEILSAPSVFSVTPFDLQGPPADNSQLIADNDDTQLIFANELLLKLIPGTTPARAQQIAAAINGNILSIIPELQLYRIRFTTDGSLASIDQAMATLKTFSEVISVVKNAEVTLAGTDCDWNNSSANCPLDPLFTGNQQWHLNKIRAKQAWNAARFVNAQDFAGSQNAPVAVIDFGVDCNHPELSGHCTQVNGNTSDHGTKVAALIAAEANTQNGVGVAWNTNILSYYGGTDSHSLANAIISAGNSNAKVLNISMVTQTSDPGAIRDAACLVADNGKLVVAAAGQPLASSSGVNYYPAALNADSNYNCSQSKLASHLLAVGASNTNDDLASWSLSGFTFSSNKVNWIDLYAPGTNIVAFSNTDPDQNGTSYAAPQISGAAAMLWALYPSLTGEELHDRLIDNAANLADIDDDGKQDKRLDLFSALGSNQLTVNFVFEDAAFRNTLGIYDRINRKATILIDNIDLQSNPSISSFSTTLYLTDEELNNLEFFLIPNGASVSADYLQNVAPANRQLEVFQDADNKWRLQDTVTNTILRGAVGEADALFSEPALNPDPGRTQIQIVGTATNYRLLWEDRPAFISDNDYNDAEFRITIQ